MSALLLDTHVWFWFVTGNAELSAKIRDIINTAIQDNVLHVAAISLWEIAMLEKKQRIILEMPCLEWLENAVKLTYTQVLPLTPAIAVESSYLPGDFHGDPAGRMIVATARVAGLKLVSRDKRLSDYSKKKYITVIRA